MVRFIKKKKLSCLGHAHFIFKSKYRWGFLEHEADINKDTYHGIVLDP